MTGGWRRLALQQKSVSPCPGTQPGHGALAASHCGRVHHRLCPQRSVPHLQAGALEKEVCLFDALVFPFPRLGEATMRFWMMAPQRGGSKDPYAACLGGLPAGQECLLWTVT